MSTAGFESKAEENMGSDRPGKVAILGGGIAGLAFALRYRQLGGQVSIHERALPRKSEGLGFIVQGNGLRALAQVGRREAVESRAYRLSGCSVRDHLGHTLIEEDLSAAKGISRRALLEALRETLPSECIQYGRRFSHFEYASSGHARRAVFENGEKVETDLFLGCDGGQSRVRAQIFPDAAPAPARVREIVSVVKSDFLVARNARRLNKIRHSGGGLALGMVPASGDRLIWFLQFDAERYRLSKTDPQSLENFVRSLTREWAGDAGLLSAATNFQHSWVCEASYLEPLEAYFHQNIALLGDAAHALPSFTSQGVSTAIEDAVVLAEALASDQYTSLHAALSAYSETRKRALHPLLEQGKRLQEEFLDPPHAGQQIPLAGSG